MKGVTSPIIDLLAEDFGDEDISAFKLCSTCMKNCRKNKLPAMSRSNGYEYPSVPANSGKLNLLSERIISPRLPYMQIRRLRHNGSYGIIGQVINIAVDVDTMVRSLPRSLDDDYAFNVNLKKNLVHKSSYLSGFVKKSDVEPWLRFLCEQPLYKHYNITVDWSVFSNSNQDQ